MICEGIGLIGIVEKHHSPSALVESCGLDELCRRPPNRRYKLIHIYLHGPDQSVELDTQRHGCLVETSDRGKFSLIECTKNRSSGHHAALLPELWNVVSWLWP